MTKPRDTYTAGIKALNETAWGAAKAVSRYGDSKYYMGRGAPAPEDRHAPQRLGDSNNLQGPGYRNDTPNDWRRGNGMKPNFQPGVHGKK